MPEIETLEKFYKHKFQNMPTEKAKDYSHFNVFRLEDCYRPGSNTLKYSRRDFYKISFIKGKHRYHYADKSIEVDGATLIFFDPNVAYRFESQEPAASGYFCIFKEEFFTGHIRGRLSDLAMFAPGGKPAYDLNEAQAQDICNLFEKMLTEIESGYRFKYDMLRNYISEMIHYALKIEPTETLYIHPDANSRITAVFNELLERQFPIESPEQRFTLRSAKDFADRLSVHVNHLNRAIRQTTGKTTTHHIARRLTGEAMALLKHTNWNIAEIGYSLGFEEPAHFNNFFKKQTNNTPSSFRNV